jgi:Zn-finger nucleic acid-binding protein
MTTRESVEIDYCPKCRGVWLDRGELDKIIDRVLADSPAPSRESAAPSRESAPESRPRYEDRRDDDDDDDDEWRRGRDRRAPQRKRRGFLGDLFEFD